jgi:hypothetical protein
MVAMRPADMPPAPPKVTFRNGMLTVEAVNSSMAGLLQAIRNKTGIEFEGGENSGERVAVTAGPAPEAEVLAAIFSGSGFDYVVVGRSDSPGIVQRVLLTPKARNGQTMNAGAAQPPPGQQQQAPEGDEEAQDDASAPDADPQDTAAQPPAEAQQQPAQPQGTEQQQNGPKTPEQLLQELKEMQQKQQQQQGAPPPNTQAVPRKPAPPR